MAFESIMRRFHARFQRGCENAVLTRPCHDAAEKRRQHPAGGCSQASGMYPLSGICGQALSSGPARVAAGSAGAAPPLSASAKEPVERLLQFRRKGHHEAICRENVPSGAAQASPRPHRYVEERSRGYGSPRTVSPTGIPGSVFLDDSRVGLATMPPPHPLWTIS